MNRIRKLVDKHSTGKKVLWLFILTNLVYVIMLVVTIPAVMHFSNGMQLLDMMPMGYDSEYINSLLGALGKEGRQAYLYKQLPVDMIYPLLFGVSYGLLIGYFLKKLDKLNSPLFYFCLLPVIAGIADYLENFGIITMLNSYPEMSQIVMGATSVFSIIKSMTTTVHFTVLLVILLILGINKLRERKASINK